MKLAKEGGSCMPFVEEIQSKREWLERLSEGERLERLSERKEKETGWNGYLLSKDDQVAR